MGTKIPSWANPPLARIPQTTDEKTAAAQPVVHKRRYMPMAAIARTGDGSENHTERKPEIFGRDVKSGGRRVFAGIGEGPELEPVQDSRGEEKQAHDEKGSDHSQAVRDASKK